MNQIIVDLKYYLRLDKVLISILLIWLFQISAIIGMSANYADWFLSKTYLTLIMQLALVLWVFKPERKGLIILGIIYALGFFAEYLGVNHFNIFGNYTYGDNLGFKLAGVPLLIGSNWAVLAIVSSTIAARWVNNKWVQITLGAFLMVFLDLFMEVVAKDFDYWHFYDSGLNPILVNLHFDLIILTLFAFRLFLL